MNRYAKDRTDKRYGPKVEKMTLFTKHVKLRFIIMTILIFFGAGNLAMFVAGWLGTDAGWQEIATVSNSYVNCSSDFVFLYDVGGAGISAGPEKREIAELYTDLCIKGYQMFTADEPYGPLAESGAEDAALERGPVSETDETAYEGERHAIIEGNNLCVIGSHPNTPVQVDPALYEALQLVTADGSRLLYMAPVYEIMKNLCAASDDLDAQAFDPAYNQAVAEDIEKIMTFVKDPDQINLAFLDKDQVCLHVSDDYLGFAEADAIETLIDFHHLMNAFIIDYMAQTLEEAGYTSGMISSYDGYSRILSDASSESALKLFGREDRTITELATLNMTDVRATVSMRAFPLSEKDGESYYVYEDGSTVTPFLNKEDGLSHPALTHLVGCSKDRSCAQILMALYDPFTRDEFRAPDSNHSDIWCAYMEKGSLQLAGQDASEHITLVSNKE